MFSTGGSGVSRVGPTRYAFFGGFLWLGSLAALAIGIGSESNSYTRWAWILLSLPLLYFAIRSYFFGGVAIDQSRGIVRVGGLLRYHEFGICDVRGIGKRKTLLMFGEWSGGAAVAFMRVETPENGITGRHKDVTCWGLQAYSNSDELNESISRLRRLLHVPEVPEW